MTAAYYGEVTRRHTAICCHKASAQAGVILATELRRMNNTVDLHYTGKLDRQFSRAKRSHPGTILTIREDMTCRLWFRWSAGVETTLADVSHYLKWLADDTDKIPDPPEYMLAQDQ